MKTAKFRGCKYMDRQQVVIYSEVDKEKFCLFLITCVEPNYKQAVWLYMLQYKKHKIRRNK